LSVLGIVIHQLYL